TPSASTMTPELRTHSPRDRSDARPGGRGHPGTGCASTRAGAGHPDRGGRPPETCPPRELNAHTAFNSHIRQESGGATPPHRRGTGLPRRRPGCRVVRSAPVTWSRPRRTVPDMADHDPSAPTADPAAPTDPTDLTADVVVLGGGPVGENVAQYAIEGTDLTAVVVEGELLGGECSYHACIPSKALLRPPAVADTAAHLPGITTPQVDRD